MDSLHGFQTDKLSFWKKNSKNVPGRPSPKKEFFGTTHKNKSSTTTSFQDFQASVSDAWELDDDEFCVISGERNACISKKVSESAAQNVLNIHRTQANDVSTSKKDAKTSSRFPGRPQLLKSNCNNPDEDYESKLERFENFLALSNPTMSELCQLSWSGIPTKVRHTAWRLLSGYLPINQERREEVLNRKRQVYWSLVAQYFQQDVRDEAYKDTYHQIHIDVPRMNPGMPLFQQTTVQEMFERILYIWAIRRPASGYVQGINDLVTPFYVVFLQEMIPNNQSFETCEVDSLPSSVRDIIEADSFWCLTKFLDGIQDNYIFAQLGIQRKVNQLQELIQRVDNVLHRHLTRHKVDYLQFSFRWLNNLLTRELPLRCTIRLWDTYLAETDSLATFQLYVCAAFLLYWRDQLLLQTDFQGLMVLLQNLPTQHWTSVHIGLLLAEAYRLKVMFTDAPNHLHNNQVQDPS